ncbi:MAG: hypothetical protein PQJ35_00175, partial [Sphaerochaetaceae bacterium]|nr:hypothetical protein [Sphaerochaetaceae bacterium]
MRKRVIAAVILAVCIATFAFAQNVNNEQKIYSIDSPVYEALTQLYISEGLALPSTTGPWSENELLLMLDRIDESSLNSVEDITYNFIYETLHMDDKAVDFGLDINLEGYYHTNTTDFTMPDDWIYTYEDRAPLLDIILETSLSEHFYGYSSLTITSAQYEDATNTDGPITNAYGENAFTSNIFLIQTLSNGDAGFSNLDLGMPYRAFGAFGGD